jgi:hypothetical protein
MAEGAGGAPSIHIGWARFVVMGPWFRGTGQVIHTGLSTISTYVAMTYTVTTRCVQGRNLVYLSPPHGRRFFVPSRGTQQSPSGARDVGMILVACEAPSGALDAAPQTALRQDSSTECWTGFWGTDDRYYARCTTTGEGATDQVAWFCFEEEAVGGGIAEPVGARSVTPVRTLALPRQETRRRTLLFRVGRSASHGCVFGVRRPTIRATALRA